MEEKIFIKTADNLKICGIWRWSEKSNQKAIILCHGISVDKDEDGLFPPLSEKLAYLGYSVFSFDFRGHGESGGKSVEVTISGELTDMETALNEVKSKKFQKIGILGASFGGGISTLYASKHWREFDFLCLWYPVLNFDHTFINPFLPWLKDYIKIMKRDLNERRWTTLNTGNNFKIGKKLFDEMKEYFPYEEMAKISIPTVIIHGDNDSYVPYRDSVEYIKSVKARTELVTVIGADHGFDGADKLKTQAIDETVKMVKKYL